MNTASTPQIKPNVPGAVLFLVGAWTALTTLEFLAWLSSRVSEVETSIQGPHPLWWWLGSSAALLATALWFSKKRNGSLSWARLAPKNLLNLALVVFLGFVTANLYFVRQSLQGLTEQATGMFEDYRFLRQQIPSPAEDAKANDAWFDAQGNLLASQQQAWCDRALPLTQLFWQTQQSTGRDTKEIAGLLTNGLYSTAYARGFLTPEELLAHKEAVFKNVSETPTHNQRLNESMWWNPIASQLIQVQAMAVAKLMPTPAGLCVDMTARARHQEGKEEVTQGIVEQCEAAFSKDRQATLQDLKRIQQSM